jgi:tetratricopeptide (TPR) repeat protein
MFALQHLILAPLEKKLRTSGGVDPLLSRRCMEKCSRLLLESTRDSLRVEQFHSGPASRRTLEKKFHLAGCYLTLYEYEAGEKIISEAFQTSENTLGQMHPLTLKLERLKLRTSMGIRQPSSMIGSFNVIEGFRELLEKFIRAFGADHFETLNCRQDLAKAYLFCEEFPDARKHLEPVFNKTLETLGPTSRMTQSMANNLARCANMQGDYDYAESILYTSFPQLSKAVAEKSEIDSFSVNPWTLQALSILAALFGGRNEDRRSEIIHQRVIDGLMAQNGQKSRTLYESVINKGQAIRDQFKYPEARKHYREWVKICDKNLGPDSEESCEMRRRLLDIDQREKKWKMASQGSKAPIMHDFATWIRLSHFNTFTMAGAVAIALAASGFFIWISRY